VIRKVIDLNGSIYSLRINDEETLTVSIQFLSLDQDITTSK
jgi:hypothetical protein